MGMDHVLYTGDLNLADVGTQEELASVLRRVRRRAGEPSLRELAARTRRGPTSPSKTILAEMLSGARFPRLIVMVAFLEACGVPNTEMRSWRRTWERVAEATVGMTRIDAAQADLDRQRQAGVSSMHPFSWTDKNDIVPHTDRSNAGVDGEGQAAGHVFISYVREDSRRVDQLQRSLHAAGIPVWRDTADLWPGEDWRAKIRRAITDNALVFVACFSRASLARSKSYQNEELIVAIEQLRLRPPENPWLIPVRFDDCEIPDRDIGGGRTLSSIQRADLFGKRRSEGVVRLMDSVLRILGHSAEISATATLGHRGAAPAPSQTQGRADDIAASSVAARHFNDDTWPTAAEVPARPTDEGDIDGARAARRLALQEVVAKPRPTTISAASASLARRLRELRCSGFPNARLTQTDVAIALSEDEPVGVSMLSAWENVRTPRIPPGHRISAYARFFATDRSLEGGPHLVPLAELTEAEDEARRELEGELFQLRNKDTGESWASPHQSWRFEDGFPITIICSELPRTVDAQLGPLSQTDSPNYTMLYSFADMDALVELFGHLKESNPGTPVRYVLASKVASDDLINHIVLLGGIAFNDVTRRLNASEELPVRLVVNEQIHSGEVFEIEGGPNHGQQFLPRFLDSDPGTPEQPGVLLEDVAMLARTPNPFNRLRTLTYCNGTQGRGVLGAVRCLTDPAVRRDNESYLRESFFKPDRFAILMRVRALGNRTISPTLKSPGTVLFRWPDE
jgi:hypothetical protein